MLSLHLELYYCCVTASAAPPSVHCGPVQKCRTSIQYRCRSLCYVTSTPVRSLRAPLLLYHRISRATISPVQASTEVQHLGPALALPPMLRHIYTCSLLCLLFPSIILYYILLLSRVCTLSIYYRDLFNVVLVSLNVYFISLSFSLGVRALLRITKRVDHLAFNSAHLTFYTIQY